MLQLFGFMTLCAVVLRVFSPWVPYIVALINTPDAPPGVKWSLALIGIGHAGALALICIVGWLPLRSSATQRSKVLSHGVAAALLLFVLLTCVPAAEMLFRKYDVAISEPTVWLLVGDNMLCRWWFLVMPLVLAALYGDALVIEKLHSRPKSRALANAWSLAITLTFAAAVLFSAWAIIRCFFGYGGLGHTEFLF